MLLPCSLRVLIPALATSACIEHLAPRPAPLAAPARFSVAAPPESVFQGTIAALTSWNFVIGYADRATGVISTSERLMPWTDALEEVVYRSSNCGYVFGHNVYHVQLAVRIGSAGSDTAAAGDSTSFRIVSNIVLSYTYGRGDEEVHRACASSGALERMLAQEILQRASSHGSLRRGAS